MAELLRMPEVAAAAATAVLSAWPLTEGAPFGTGDAVAVVETEKAEVEVPAGADGVLLKTLVAPGAVVEVGSPIAVLGAVGERVADLGALLAELGVAEGPASPPVTAVRRDVPDEPARPAPHSPSPPAGTGGRVFSSPLARRMAREAGLKIAEIPGTGPGGRVVRRDVEAAIAARPEGTPDGTPVGTPGGTSSGTSGAVAPAAVPTTQAAPAIPAARSAPPAGAAYEDVPHSRMRRAIAARLTASKREAPHFYLRATCRVDALLDVRRRINANAGENGEKVSVNDLIVKAVAKAHCLVPEMNAIWTEEAVRRFARADVCVAIAAGNGLVTPVLRDVGALSVSAVAARVRDYAGRARDGGLRQEDLEGGSITVTNLGMYGVEEFAAIINPPQSAILAVGEARREPVAVEEGVEVATVLRLVLSVDHRPIDGVLAARWMRELTGLLEDPIRILV
jgi:pyruvate dehydrogenase E2 component (dihydrolipoamide acetyltransferase)